MCLTRIVKDEGAGKSWKRCCLKAVSTPSIDDPRPRVIKPQRTFSIWNTQTFSYSFLSPMANMKKTYFIPRCACQYKVECLLNHYSFFKFIWDQFPTNNSSATGCLNIFCYLNIHVIGFYTIFKDSFIYRNILYFCVYIYREHISVIYILYIERNIFIIIILFKYFKYLYLYYKYL